MNSHATPPVAHGGLVDGELAPLGVLADDVLDVSVNVNPYGPCPSVRRAVAAAAADGPFDRFLAHFPEDGGSSASVLAADDGDESADVAAFRTRLRHPGLGGEAC